MSQAPRPASVAERTVRELLDARASSVPSRTALIANSLVSGREEQVSYAQLRERAGRVAAALAAAGVGKGDRVGILLANDGALEAHLTYHASHRLGAINVPLNTRYVKRELAYVLEFVEPAAIVFSHEFAELLGGLGDSLGDAALLEVGPGPAQLGVSFSAVLATTERDVEPAPLIGEDDADWIFTSGTTGNPKAVALTHQGSVCCGYQAIALFGLFDEAVYQSFAPFFTSTGSHTNLLGCLAAGCTYVVEPEFHVRETLERMQRHRVTSAFLISAVLQLIFARLSAEEIAGYEFPALQRVCYGAQPMGAPFYHRVWEEIGKGWDVDLVVVYGLTEGGTSGIFLSAEDHPEALMRMGPYGISIGRTPFADWVEYAVLAPDGDELGVDEIGELCLRGPSTMSRYVRDPEATAAALKHGWLYTGDMALRDDAGFVYYVDRGKQLIRRGGLNISSAEVEGVLAEHPGVLEAAAVGMPNPVLGEDVRGVVVAASDPPPTETELLAFCRERLADYKVPAQIDFVDALPRNAMNRVMKGVLRGETGALAAPEA